MISAAGNLPPDSADPINRCAISSAVHLKLKDDAEGGLTRYLQYESPGADLEANGLPAHDAPFYG